jgi:hypothetical protein
MKIESSLIDGGTIVLKEVYNSIILETSEGNQFAICMRDDTVEMKVVSSDISYRADMKTGCINKMGGKHE